MIFMITFYLTNSIRRFDIPAKALLLATLAHFALNAIFLIWLDWGIFGAALANSIHLILRFVFCYIFTRRHPELGLILKENYDTETF
jgi:Na+-driven multidrug efflux pump